MVELDFSEAYRILNEENNNIIYGTYLDRKHTHKVTFNLSTTRLVGDSMNRADHNVAILGTAHNVKTENDWYNQGKLYHLIFPKTTFWKAFNSIGKLDTLINYIQQDKKIYLEFKIKNQKKYEILKMSLV